MTAASRRARRPSALQAVGNPADVAPGGAAGDVEHQADEDGPDAVAGEPTSPAPDAEPASADTEPTDTPPAAPEKPATARRGRGKATKPAASADGATPAPAASTAKRSTRSRGKTAGADADAVKAEVAETAGRADTGRPRVPRQGPVTRMSLDLAVSETRELERIAGTIGREVGRAGGRSRLRVQHLARVAVRRLITDPEFRALVTDDFRHGRDELRRPD